MLKGIHLTLMIGPAVPAPAPREVTDSLTSVQVTSGKGRSGFQLTFTVGKKSSILTTLLPNGFFDPIKTRVMLVVTLNGTPNVIMDGLVTQQSLTNSNEPGQSTLTITGEDISVAMDLVKAVTPFPAMPDVAKILLLLAPFAIFGLIPKVTAPISLVVKSFTEGWESQADATPLEYIQGLAQRCGYVFYIEPGPVPGQNTAYFGPDISLSVPQPALTMNAGEPTNVESLSFTQNGMVKSVRIYTILDPITHKVPIPIPVPNVNIFKPALGARHTLPVKVEMAKDGGTLSPDEAARDILGYLMSSPAAIQGTGSLDVLRYGGLLQARRLVGVRGVSPTYDGTYYVDSVTHNIKRGEYKQNFTLSRDGVLSSTSRVSV